MSELDNFIEDFEQGLGDKISELKKPKQKFNRLPKVKITNINPMYAGNIELLDKSIAYNPVYTLFESRPQIFTLLGEPAPKYICNSFAFLYVNSRQVWNVHCDFIDVIAPNEYDTFINVRVLANDGWGQRIDCDVTVECKSGLTVYEFADSVITYLWRYRLVE